jgi:epsilon-lactone hydrolase
MKSFKSRIINYLIVHRHLFRGKLKKEVFDFNTSIGGFREQCEKGASKYAKIPEGVSIREEIIAGCKSEWLISEGADETKLIMYVHGGGYVSGSCNDHRGFVSKFAKNIGVSCLVYEYRLAPEHTYPAALDDSISVYQCLLSSGYKPENIIIAGESAGGGLCLALLLALKDRDIALPAATVSITPWADLSCSSESYVTKNKKSAAPLNSWTVFSKYYAGDHSTKTPFMSPLFGNLEGLPPIMLNAGTDDELFDEAEKFYLKAKAAGVDIKFTRGEGMIHCYPLLAPMFREATEAMNEIVGFVRKHLKME